LRVQVQPDESVTGEQRWFVRVQCRPDAAAALADSMAARDDVSWVSITSGGAEIVCVAFTDPTHEDGSVLHAAAAHSPGAQLHRLRRPAHARQQQRSQVDALRQAAYLSPGITELARDGRAGVVALARATGWPQSRVSARLTELLTSGAVHVTTDLAPGLFGFHATAYLWLTVTPGDLHQTGQALSLHPEATFTAALTGTANLLVTITCRDLAALYDFVTSKVGPLPAVRQVEIVPVLHRLKQAGTQVRAGRLSILTSGA
jgi:DNA-binding Lrp family transcriptional regulator